MWCCIAGMEGSGGRLKSMLGSWVDGTGSWEMVGRGCKNTAPSRAGLAGAPVRAGAARHEEALLWQVCASLPGGLLGLVGC